MTNALPPVVDADTWQRQLDDLRVREKAATRELDAIGAQRRRMPMVKMPEYTLEGEEGPIRLADIFDGESQLIVYNHMRFPGEQWQCPGCTGFTSQFTRLEFLDNYDARFVIVTQGPIDDALAYKRRIGNQMTWYSTGRTVRSAPTSAHRRETGSPSTYSYATATLSIAPGTPTVVAPNSSVTASP